MTTLRVRLDAPPERARSVPWALFDGNGRKLAGGNDPPDRWPSAERREAILAADVVRVVALTLPPLPAGRVASAAAYALEDRLATSLDEAVVAVGPRRDDGRVTAVVVQRELAEALARAEPRFDRALAEPQLVAQSDGWAWCDSGSGSFVRTGEGSAFATGRVPDEALPAELEAALRQSARAGNAPERVVAHRAAATDPGRLAAWTRASGVPFVAAAPWDWASASMPSFDGAIDVLGPTRARSVPPRDVRRSGLVTGAALIAIAAGLHLVATAGTWAWRNVELARERRALESIAREIGGTNAADVARMHAEGRHRAGLTVPTDMLPLLARAAPALAALPNNALRSATYRAGVVTVDLAAIDEAALVALRDGLNGAGLDVVHAQSAGGVRARIAIAP
jgi:type II secretion system protein L